jgi:hypothetical protein
MSRDSWVPLRTEHKHRPEAGDLIAQDHAVWRVEQVADLPLDDADRQKWLDHGMPDPETWPQRPYQVNAEWVGGKEPAWSKRGGSRKLGIIRVPAGKYTSWRVYQGERWPQCSCCGEPMPCRAELEDRQVTASLDSLARLEAIPPGACWACAEPITTRQKTVTYPGENLDLPGGQQVYFHTRRGCVRQAHEYEERWVAADPRRERILTWPHCDGILVVHADGSSECQPGQTQLRGEVKPQPDCRGHLTHDHSAHQACYIGESGCLRGCSPEGHPGTRTTPRPERREPSVGGIF